MSVLMINIMNTSILLCMLVLLYYLEQVPEPAKSKPIA